MAATTLQQQPYVYGSISKAFVYLKAPVPDGTKVAPNPDNIEEDAAWSFLSNTTDIASLRKFVSQFPSGKHRLEADNRITELTRLDHKDVTDKPPVQSNEKLAMRTDEPRRTSPPRGQVCADRSSSAGNERYCASSRLAPEFGNSYDVRNLFTGGSSVAWVEGTPGYGVGEWITVEFDRLRDVRSLEIDNGYQKNSEIYFKNTRVKRVRVVFSNGESVSFPLSDKFGTQSLNLSHPISSYWLQVIVEDVYPGKKYSDTAISKLYVTSERAQ
jgi:hypothetical protein